MQNRCIRVDALLPGGNTIIFFLRYISKHLDWCKCREHRSLVDKFSICVQEMWVHLDQPVTNVPWIWILVIGFRRGDNNIIIIIKIIIVIVIVFVFSPFILVGKSFVILNIF